MSAEGVGLAIGFGGLFITLVGLAVAGGTAYGTLKTLVLAGAEKQAKEGAENKAGHDKIFESINAINLTVAKIGENVTAMNSIVTIDSTRITELERHRPADPPCTFHIDLEKKHIQLEGRVDAHLERGNT